MPCYLYLRWALDFNAEQVDASLSWNLVIFYKSRISFVNLSLKHSFPCFSFPSSPHRTPQADYAADNTASNGVNAGEVLSKAIKLFQDNPYMAIGLSGKTGLQATESDIKKSFRKYALKYHPDKTQNKTGLMFTVIQQAYATLSDPEKRKRHDERARRAAEKLEKMRKMKETEDRRRRQEGHMDEKFGKHGKSSDTRPPPVSTNSFRQPPQSQEEAEYRAFNKRFYEDFRRKVSAELSWRKC